MHNIFQSAKELISDHAELTKKVSEIDAEILNFYHILELEKVDAVSISKVVKKLRVALRERRRLKEKVAMTTTVLTFCQSIVDKEEVIQKRSADRLAEYDRLSIASLKKIKEE